MKHLFVPYQIAEDLKELGFNEPCLTTFKLNGDKLSKNIDFDGYKNSEFLQIVTAPLYQQVIDFLRERGLHFKESTFHITVKSRYPDIVIQQVIFDNKGYYRALEAAIKESIKLIKINQ